MTKLTNSRSTWKFEHLVDETIGSIVEARDAANSVSDGADMFERDMKAALHKFLNGLPDGEILSDGYYKGFVPAPKPQVPATLCKSGADIREWLMKAYEVNMRHFSKGEKVLLACIEGLPDDESKFKIYSAFAGTFDRLFPLLVVVPADPKEMTEAAKFAAFAAQKEAWLEKQAKSCHTADKQDCHCTVVGHTIPRCPKCFQYEPAPVIMRELSRRQVKDKRDKFFGYVFIEVEAQCTKCGTFKTSGDLAPH